MRALQSHAANCWLAAVALFQAALALPALGEDKKPVPPDPDTMPIVMAAVSTPTAVAPTSATLRQRGVSTTRATPQGALQAEMYVGHNKDVTIVVASGSQGLGNIAKAKLESKSPRGAVAWEFRIKNNGAMPYTLASSETLALHVTGVELHAVQFAPGALPAEIEQKLKPVTIAPGKSGVAIACFPRAATIEMVAGFRCPGNILAVRQQ